MRARLPCGKRPVDRAREREAELGMPDLVDRVGVRRRDQMWRRAEGHEIECEPSESGDRSVLRSPVLPPLRGHAFRNLGRRRNRHFGVRPRSAAHDAREKGPTEPPDLSAPPETKGKEERSQRTDGDHGEVADERYDIAGDRQTTPLIG